MFGKFVIRSGNHAFKSPAMFKGRIEFFVRSDDGSRCCCGTFERNVETSDNSRRNRTGLYFHFWYCALKHVNIALLLVCFSEHWQLSTMVPSVCCVILKHIIEGNLAQLLRISLEINAGFDHYIGVKSQCLSERVTQTCDKVRVLPVKVIVWLSGWCKHSNGRWLGDFFHQSGLQRALSRTKSDLYNAAMTKTQFRLWCGNDFIHSALSSIVYLHFTDVHVTRHASEPMIAKSYSSF